jgi:hypothetical protein
MRRRNKYRFYPSVIKILLVMVIVTPFFRAVKINIDTSAALASTQSQAQVLQLQYDQLQSQDVRVREEMATLAVYSSKPSKEEISAYIKQVFGKHSDEALAVARCESGVSADHININKDGSMDFSTFQINSTHARRFGSWFKANWMENVRVAKVLFDEQGWNPWLASNSCHHLLASN